MAALGLNVCLVIFDRTRGRVVTGYDSLHVFVEVDFRGTFQQLDMCSGIINEP
jgi:hypothetical protein